MNTSLVSKEQVAEGTMLFKFEKPAGFEYRAGQSIDLTLMDPPETDAEGNMRAYTLASSPFEDHLVIATRLRDTAFKRVLKSLEPGAPLAFEGPFGSFTLRNTTAKPAVFLAGGIGITPFRSMIRQSLHEKTGHAMMLFYFNRTPIDAPFLEELSKLQNNVFKMIVTMTRDETWEGERGYITQELLRKYVPDLAAPIYYIAGPPKMVAGMYQMLVAAGIDTDNVRTEEFSGYLS